MTYPNSNNVAPGDATAASQYNNLRSDAVYLGGTITDSGSLKDRLSRGLGQLKLVKTADTIITLYASTTFPCAVIIDGSISMISTDITITVDPILFPQPKELFIFAKKTANAPGFTLILSDSSTEQTATRLIGRFIWTSTVIVSGTVYSIDAWSILKQFMQPNICEGRLTLTSGQPFSSVDIPSSNVIYFTPCGGNRITLYGPGGWELFTFNEISFTINPTDFITSSCYDIFITISGTGIEMTTIAWGNLTTRGDMLATIDGVLVLSNDHTKRYVGTFSPYSDGFTCDTCTQRLLWNYYHQTRKQLAKYPTLWSYDVPPYNDIWYQYGAYNSVTNPTIQDVNEVEIVTGIETADVRVEARGARKNSASASVFWEVGITLDAVMVIQGVLTSENVNNATNSGVEYTGSQALAILENLTPGSLLGKRHYTETFRSISGVSSAVSFAGTFFNASNGAKIGITGHVMG